MEEKFVLTKKDKRKAFLVLYGTVLSYIALSILIALLIAYAEPFHSWFYLPESTPENPSGSVLSFGMLYAPFIFAFLYFRRGENMGNNGKMNIAALLSIAMGCKLHFYFYYLGLQKALFVIAIAFILFNLAVFLALIIKKDFSKHKRGWVLIALVFTVAILVCQLLKIEVLNSTLFYSLSFLGIVLTFLDIQDWWLKLNKVPDQLNFDRFYFHTLLNLIAGFWLIHLSFDLNKVLVKLLVSIFRVQRLEN